MEAGLSQGNASGAGVVMAPALRFMQKLPPELQCPKGLTREGRTAHQVITKILREANLLETGGCKAFYSPKEWKARGEDYGTTSELIVVYDGGNVRELFEPEFSDVLFDKLNLCLKEKGLWFELCTCWYSAIYKI
jgi:hypothetical protein